MYIEKVTPASKGDDSADYRPISIFHVFLNIKLYKHLNDLKMLYLKQFSFQKGHSTFHALLQLVDQIYESFERNEYRIGIFIALCKAFDADDHNILLKKLEIWACLPASSVVLKLLKQQETVYSD